MKVVLSGAETSVHIRTLVKSGAPDVLFTYSYMKKRGDKGIPFLRAAKEGGCKVMLGSGAGAIRNKYPWLCRDLADENGKALAGVKQATLNKARKAAGDPSTEEVLEELERLHISHVNFVQDNYELIDSFAELDLDSIMGDRIWAWRDNYLEDIPQDKSELIITPHYNWDDERLWSGKFKYMGVSLSTAEFKNFFAERRNQLEPKKIKLHGWGKTDATSIKEHPYYSVDSFSWLAGTKYGLTFRYRGGYTLDPGVPKEQRAGLKSECEALGVDHAGLMADNSRAVDHWNATQWAEYAKDLKKYTTNSYWLSSLEVAEIQKEVALEAGTNSALERHDPKTGILASEAKTLNYTRFCNTCFIGGKCPAFKEDATCELFQRVDASNPDAVKDLLTTLVGVQAGRILFAAFSEQVTGEMLDPEVSNEMSQLLTMMEKIRDLNSDKATLEIKAQGSGVITQLLSQFGNRRKEQQEPQQVEVTQNEEPEAIDAEFSESDS